MLEQHVNILQKKCEELSSKQSSATCKDISPYHQTESLSMEGVRLTYRFDDVRGEFQKLEAESERAMKIGGDVHETNKEELDGKSIKDTPSVGVVEDLEKIDPKQPRKPILLIRVADNYFVLPSNPKFFTIDWENEYTRNAPHKYVCNRCQVVEQFKTKMEDHVWVKHYYECYKCPTCYIHRPSSLQSRYSIRRHVKQFHPHLFKCRESKQ
ncbi:uncharacterized protein LOC107047774 [Diachasma alloeum]|uniref:uncharacterized protein LOC107047774 n=1 Tax=Diachasma alloeum TaxID=454923 RepID=UPI0007382BD7|nr:uncharacterized protein LOC107047774 [Diachasma alloeum]